MKEPKTLQEAIVVFADADSCIAYLSERRWPDGVVVCPTCGRRDASYAAKRRVWQCRSRHPKAQFSIKVGTVMEDSPIPLEKWLPAMWMMANSKNGVSSWEIHRSLGVTQKTAWFMTHRIRMALGQEPEGKMGGHGPVEVDEAFIGGTPKFMHAKRRMSLGTGIGGRTAKVPVMGMLDREARQVRAQVVPNVKRETLQNAILAGVEKGSTIYTDNASTFDSLQKEYIHDQVNHVTEYVRGQVHTQGIENFWSLLKRGLKGTYIAVEPFHLDRYIGEQVFRYNNRATRDNPLNDADRFALAVSQIVGKRLTYAELTGRVGETTF